MNRRGFLGSLFAGAVMLAAPKLALARIPQMEPMAAPAPPQPQPIDTRYINREQAKADLAGWYGNEMDRLMFEYLMGQG